MLSAITVSSTVTALHSGSGFGFIYHSSDDKKQENLWMIKTAGKIGLLDSA